MDDDVQPRSVSVGTLGIVCFLLSDRVSCKRHERHERQASFWFFLFLQALREMTEQFLLLRLGQRIHGKLRFQEGCPCGEASIAKRCTPNTSVVRCRTKHWKCA